MTGARVMVAVVAIAALSGPASGTAAPGGKRPSGLVQLAGRSGCLIDRARPAGTCAPARALDGAGPFKGSKAIVVSPDGRNVYVAASADDAVAVFRRDGRTGALTQPGGAAGCVAAGGQWGCASARGLAGTNSVAVSPDGRTVYATGAGSNSVTVFRRNRTTGGLTQLGGAGGCVTNAATSGCTRGRALDGADVVVVSPDGRNVYVGAFQGNAIAVFARDAASGAVHQPAGAAGCVAAEGAGGCAPARALRATEGLAVSPDGTSVYAAAALGNALVAFARDPAAGTLEQLAGTAGCVSDPELPTCTAGRELLGADDVVVSPDGRNVYVASGLGNSVTTFARTRSNGAVTQLDGTRACVQALPATNCSLGHGFGVPEAVALSPDGANVFVAAFGSAAVNTLVRDGSDGSVMQGPLKDGCVAIPGSALCRAGRRLGAPGAVTVSPDGRNVYATAFANHGIAVFRRLR